ncbi:hypothetical protein AB1Y57_19455 [Citrobacter freundii]
MNKLTDISKNGFRVCESRENELDIAFISLRLALKAYFSTYRDLKLNLSSLNSNIFNIEDVDKNYSLSYYESCTETIVHFQHFFELACKHILKNEHPLLADVASKKAVVLSKLLKGEMLNEIEDNSLQSIEFSEAISRLLELIKNESINDFKLLNFILSGEEVLRTVNSLRNRIWHRGLFVLRYEALDELVCRFILPLVSEFLSLNVFYGNEINWKYKDLHCNVDPISELSNMNFNTAFELDKVAFLKEMGRAAYNNPLYETVLKRTGRQNFSSLFDNASIQKAEDVANHELQKHHAELKACPVCGVNSLILYPESDCEYNNDNEVSNVITYIWKITCECCGFSLHNEFKNAKDYVFNNIEDFWV